MLSGLLLLIPYMVHVSFSYDLEHILPMIDQIATEKSNGSITKCFHLYLDNKDPKFNASSSLYHESGNSVYQYWVTESPYEMAKYQSKLRYFAYDVIGVALTYPSQYFHYELRRTTKSSSCIVLIIPRLVKLLYRYEYEKLFLY